MNHDETCQQCEKNPATSPHICPYDKDVNSDIFDPDNPVLCNCCADCEQECSDSI
jgi:hypothetical protein